MRRIALCLLVLLAAPCVLVGAEEGGSAEGQAVGGEEPASADGDCTFSAAVPEEPLPPDSFWRRFWADYRAEFLENYFDGPVKTNVLSFDFGALLFGMRNGGLGAGIQDEWNVYPHWALKSRAGVSFFSAEGDGLYCLSFSMTVLPEWYPLSRTLSRLYLGVGPCMDYLLYVGSGADNAADSGLDISLVSVLGYKLVLPFNLMIDACVGYKFSHLQWATALDGTVSSFLAEGFQFGLSFRYTKKLPSVITVFRNARKPSPGTPSDDPPPGE